MYRISSIFLNKCPNCGKGDFFVTKGAYTKGFDKMHSKCSACGENYSPEPGFYQGALYVSYAFYVAFMVIYFLIFVNFFEDYINYFLISIIPVMIILTPLFYRMARRAWFSMLMKTHTTVGNGKG